MHSQIPIASSEPVSEEAEVHDRTLDNPVQSPENDEFNRWPFSKRLADTIAAFDARAGAPVIGIYGRWGYGKSTVLNFIRTQLQREHDSTVEILEFNPWRFKDQDALTSAFFHGLASAIDETLGGTALRAGQILEYGSSLLSIIPIGGSAAAKVAEKVGARLAFQSLEDERQKIIRIMRKSKRKVVVLIDDIDRLDRDEVLSILKIVRLTANFPQIVYVLAFDDEMVARAAAQSFGGASDSGRQFLEKIVQYPFIIPAVGRRRLLSFIEKRAREACASADIVLDEIEWTEFNSLVELHLLPRLVTPRQAIRYGNALRFALPMLKGEVNTLDQISVEGLRILFPELYAYVRDNSQMFAVNDTPVGPIRYQTLRPTRVNSSESHIKLAEKIMPDASLTDQTAGGNLLFHLFGNPRKPASIANARYFDRYFSYTISPDDITDKELQELVLLCKQDDNESAGIRLGELAQRNQNVLLGRLRALVGQIDRGTTERIARMLAREGALFYSSGVLNESSARAEAGALIAELILHCPGTPELRGELALRILNEADPLSFALLIFRGLSDADFFEKTKYFRDGDSDSLLPDSSNLDLREALIDRISAAARICPPYEALEPEDALSCLVLWHHSRSAELKAYVTMRIKNNPAEAAKILDTVGRQGWSNFQFLVSMVDVPAFNEALDIHFSPMLSRGEWTSQMSLLSDFRGYLRVRQMPAKSPTLIEASAGTEAMP
jgi:hypothetical protein